MLTMLVAFARMALTFRDVRALAETRRQAMTDDLTSMPNRRHFLRRVHDGIIASRATGDERGAADRRPRPLQGARTTRSATTPATSCCARWASACTGCCARATRPRGWAATSSGCCSPTPCDGASAELVAEKILEAIAQPFPIKSVGLRVTASIGIALFPEHADDDEQLMQHADVAMYEAKAGATRVRLLRA